MKVNAKQIANVIGWVYIGGCAVGAIYCYGKAHYHRGKRDAYIEMGNELKRIADELSTKNDTEETEESLLGLFCF